MIDFRDSPKPPILPDGSIAVKEGELSTFPRHTHGHGTHTPPYHRYSPDCHWPVVLGHHLLSTD